MKAKYYIFEDNSANRIYVVDINFNIISAYNLREYRCGRFIETNETGIRRPDSSVFCFKEFDSAHEAIGSLMQGCFYLPSEEFTAYKICVYLDTPVLVELTIPEDAERTKCLLSNKCRCDKAYVERIEYINDGTLDEDYLEVSEATSFIEKKRPLKYKVGQEVISDKFSHDEHKECDSGIHFFISRADAMDYYYNEIVKTNN